MSLDDACEQKLGFFQIDIRITCLENGNASFSGHPGKCYFPLSGVELGQIKINLSGNPHGPHGFGHHHGFFKIFLRLAGGKGTVTDQKRQILRD
jgi:hypothetical protein